MNTNAVNQVAENVSGYTESEKSSKVSGKTIGEPKLYGFKRETALEISEYVSRGHFKQRGTSFATQP